MMNKLIQFGKLQVISQDATRKGYVICRCDCGNEKSIRKTSLTKTKEPTRSCGCLQRQKAVRTGTKTIGENSYEQISANLKYNTNIQVISTNKPPKNNKSGHKGVWFNKSRKKWEAYLMMHSKKIHLGRYASKEQAIKTRQAAEKKYYKPILNKVKKECKE